MKILLSKKNKTITELANTDSNEKAKNSNSRLSSLSEKGALGCFVSSHYKATKKYKKTFIEGILGGFFISLAFVVALIASKPLDTSVRTVMVSAIFPLGILLVTFIGGSLYTTNCIGFINAYAKSVKYKQYFLNLTICYLANIVGSFLVFGITILTGILVPYIKDANGKYLYTDNGNFSEVIANISFTKLGVLGTLLDKNQTITVSAIIGTFFSNILSGIICNIFVCVTLYITFTTKNIAAIFFMIWLSIFAFVLSQTQHSVANLILIFCNMAQTISFNLDSTMNSVATATHHFNTLMPVYFIGVNLIPSIIGNFLGGGILIPGFVYTINKEKIQKISKDLASGVYSEMVEDVKSKIKVSASI